MSTDQADRCARGGGEWSAERVHTRLIPFLDYYTEIRQVICPTNAIESLNAFAVTFGDRFPAAETY